MKRAALRPQAEADLLERTARYAEQGGAALAERFFDEARFALARAEEDPAIGSPRAGRLADVPGLRSWRLTHFPVRWFYIEQEDRIDVLRMLAERQDIASIFAGEAG